MTGIVVPGKLYGVMASGRPAVFVGPAHCETADTIRKARCGLTVRLGDAEGLVDVLLRLASDRDEADEMGRRGRSAFLKTHERGPCCAKWSAVVGELVTDRRTAAAQPESVLARVAGETG
jgi:colanic acid biosynthesis glycosyl transferase WcaI